MTNIRNRKWLSEAAAASLVAVIGSTPIGIAQAGPRDAPAASLDPAARVSDVYFFRSWEDPSKAVLIMNVLPGQDPADGPAYFGFDENVVYRLHVDNDMDGKADDVVYEIRFDNENRPAYGSLTFPLPYIGNPNIMSRPELRGITAIDGPGSEGITWRQIYTVTEIRGHSRTQLFKDRVLVAAPSNVGPVTMPDYEMLAAQAIYEDESNGIRVFAGQRADSFYGDTGALFDGAAPRRMPPVLMPQEDADDNINPFGVNRFQGFNVQAIALEVPVDRLTADHRQADAARTPFLGVYASAHRGKRVGRSARHRHFGFDDATQISRMGNPMVNTLIIDAPNKDKYNESRPEQDAEFAALFSDPPLARAPASEIFGIPVPPPPRTDLLSLYLKYPGQRLNGTECARPCADLLRLNVRVPPTAPENQHRMGSLLGTDPAGLPNGRRPNDDPMDFAVRIVGGPALIGGRVSDGVNYASGTPGAGTSDGPGYGRVAGNRLDVTSNGIVKEFPFLATPHDGRAHRHNH